VKEIKIDNLGRIVVPINIRKALSITTDTPLQIRRDEGCIVITPLNKTCALCGGEVTDEHNIRLCTACINEVKKY
jgi:transcriptional pleiotropic regulator of transition state genes